MIVRRPRDHPRSRGVDTGCTTAGTRPVGSSPLARGRPGRRPGQARLPRIIPARAGSTTGTAGAQRPSRDHPRSRGVDWTPNWIVDDSAGSSPLARGRRPWPGRRRSSRRIIPARAGSTPAMRLLAAVFSDHPRSRGVDVTVTPRSSMAAGSSPLARGRPSYSADDEIATRIIPARAGSTGPGASAPGTCGDHPRSRGVDYDAVLIDCPPSGSSPLARGRPNV